MEYSDKVQDLKTAIASHVEDDMVVALEGFGHLIPFAAGHEIVRQGRRGLTLCRMTPDLLADQMIAAGTTKRLVASFFASGSAGSLHEVRRRIESGLPDPLEIEEYSHFGMVCRYQAGAAKLPFFPIKSYVGSDLPKINPRIRRIADPYGGGDIYVVPALNPDVTIVHAQRADRLGNVQMWGILGAQQEAAFAAGAVIATVEEIVDHDVVRSDPNRTVLPSHIVSAVVPCSGGAHPSYAQGFYDRDNAFYREWEGISREPDLIVSWLDRFVHGVPDREAYLAELGAERWSALGVDERMTHPVNFGRRRIGVTL